MKKSIIILLFSLLFLNAQDIDYLKNKKLNHIVSNLDEVLLSNKESDIENIIEDLEKLLEADGYSPEVASYFGSLTAKMATFTWMPWSKLLYASDGSKIMDKAVKKAPKNIVIRLNRVFAYIEFPDALKKGSFIQQDIRFLLASMKTTDNKGLRENMATALSMFFLKQKDDTRYKKYYSMIEASVLKQRVDTFAQSL